MQKPIDKLEFWKDRIDTAQRDYYSVYVTSDRDWKRIFDAHKNIIESVITDHDKVLDAGCGYGRMSELFLPKRYIGIDFSPDFVAWAKELYPHNTFLTGNLKELPFADKEFDWAVCVSIRTMVIANLGEEEWKKMEKELKRVCKKVLILEYENPEPFEIL